jgi:hypothetical protein
VRSNPVEVAEERVDTLAAVRAAPRDPVVTLYRTLLVYAAVAVLILIVGLGEFLYFERPGQASGYKADVGGVFLYDPSTQKTTGPDRTSFSRSETFAAVVDWSSLPPDVTVDARWYDSFRVVVGQVGPGTPTQLANQTVVPVTIPEGLKHLLPGRYIFVVERWQDGVPVEVLARRIVVVQRS